MNFVVLINAVQVIGLAGLMALMAFLFPETRGAFALSALWCGLGGALVALAVSNRVHDFRRIHIFPLTASVWLVAAAAGGLPLWLWQLGPVDAFFEAMSGITTTGSTVMTGLDTTPAGILLWRALLQWIGGIGFIVTGIAFLPILRVGGMQLFRSESSELGEKELTSAARFASATFGVYITLSLLCALAYAAGGMTFLEATVHAMTTLSTGGYSTSDASFGHFDSGFLQWTATFFMASGSLPFAWYIRVIHRQTLRSEQVRMMLRFFGISILLLTAWRVIADDAPVLESLRLVAFNVVSVVTTTGYAVGDYTTWGPFAVAAFFTLTAIGGCTGSTAGGAKTMRWIILFRSIRSAIRKIHSPHAVTQIKYEGRVVGEDVINGVINFFLFYMATVFALAGALEMLGLDLQTAISGALTAVANVGPGVGDTIGPAGNFQSLPDAAKWLLSFGMYVGRLEMLTVYVLMSTTFWRDVT